MRTFNAITRNKLLKQKHERSKEQKHIIIWNAGEIQVTNSIHFFRNHTRKDTPKEPNIKKQKYIYTSPSFSSSSSFSYSQQLSLNLQNLFHPLCSRFFFPFHSVPLSFFFSLMLILILFFFPCAHSVITPPHSNSDFVIFYPPRANSNFVFFYPICQIQSQKLSTLGLPRGRQKILSTISLPCGKHFLFIFNSLIIIFFKKKKLNLWLF